jgi:hypothetical protein
VWDSDVDADADASADPAGAASAPRGLAFGCGGRALLPRAAPGLSVTLAACAASLALFVWTAAANADSLGAGFPAVCAALMLPTLLCLGVVLAGDPGVMPRHVTSVRGLAGARLAPPPFVSDLALGPAAAAALEAEAEAPAGGAATVKFCKTCRLWRPLSAHHCSACNACVAGFDHHCDFLGKCVGAGNMRSFLLLLWLMLATSALCFTFCATVAARGIVVAVAAGGAGGAGGAVAGADAQAVQTRLVAAGGALVGAVALCCVFLPAVLTALRRCLSGPTCFVLALPAGLVGFGSLLAAYVRFVGAGDGARAVPGFLGAPFFLLLTLQTLLVAGSMTCTVAARSTTKAELRRAAAREAAAKARREAAAGGEGGKAARGAAPPPPLVAVVAAANPGRTGDESRRAPEAAAVVTAAAAAAATRGEAPTHGTGTSLSAIPGFAERVRIIAALMLSRGPRRLVDFSADARELRAAVLEFERAAFLRAEEQSRLAMEQWERQQRGEAAVEEGANSSRIAPPPPPPPIDERSLRALSLSVDAGYLDDAIGIGAATRSAQPVRGVLVGLDFCLPGYRLVGSAAPIDL